MKIKSVHDHFVGESGKQMNKKQKITLIRIIISALLLAALHFADEPIINITAGISSSINAYPYVFFTIFRLILYLIPYIIIGYDVIRKALKGIKNHQPMDESLLMCIATLGAMILAVYKDSTGGHGDYDEAIAVMLFYQTGEWFQSVEICPDSRLIWVCRKHRAVIRECRLTGMTAVFRITPSGKNRPEYPVTASEEGLSEYPGTWGEDPRCHQKQGKRSLPEKK